MKGFTLALKQKQKTTQKLPILTKGAFSWAYRRIPKVTVPPKVTPPRK